MPHTLAPARSRFPTDPRRKATVVFPQDYATRVSSHAGGIAVTWASLLNPPILIPRRWRSPPNASGELHESLHPDEGTFSPSRRTNPDPAPCYRCFSSTTQPPTRQKSSQVLGALQSLSRCRPPVSCFQNLSPTRLIPPRAPCLCYRHLCRPQSPWTGRRSTARTSLSGAAPRKATPTHIFTPDLPLGSANLARQSSNTTPSSERPRHGSIYSPCGTSGGRYFDWGSR